MSINGALQIGQSAILASQAAIQIAGNNMANAATPGYSRQIARLAPGRGEMTARGSIGTGVQIERIIRAVDVALQGRARAAISEQNAANVDQRFLNAIEAVRNELGNGDLSSRLSAFFNGFSELANAPGDDAVRAVVLQNGSGLANSIRQLRAEHVRTRGEIDRSLEAAARTADGILAQIAEVNVQIVGAEQGGASQANALRDRRDQLLDELSQHLEVSTIEQPNGALDVLVGSVPVVLAGQSRGVELRVESAGSERRLSLRVRADGTTLRPDGGQIGALFRQRADTVDPAIADLDRLARELAYQVNRIHSQGQGLRGFTSVTAMNAVRDPSASLASAEGGAGHPIRNGSFEVHLTNVATGERTSVLVSFDPANTSLHQLAARISEAMPDGTGGASVTSDGRLRLDAATGYEIGFANDSSGALAALGVNGFFGGRDATDLAVNQALLDDPRLLVAGRGHEPGSNAAALDLAALQDLGIESLGGRSIRGYWQSRTTDLAVRTQSANARAESALVVRESLEAQIQATSGVSIDEESIHMLGYQRQFQAAARYVATIDETLRTLLEIV